MENPERIGRIKIVQPRSKGKKIAIGLALTIAIFIVVGQLLSTEYRVIRVKKIKVKPAVIHPYVNDLNNWESWFPWDKLDERLDFTLGDITSGVGANLNWIGDDGEGLLTFTKSSPEKGIDYKLSLHDGNFICDVSLHYTELKKGKTYVSWAVKGYINKPVIGGYLALLMEPMAGSILEEGLKQLKKNIKRDIKKQNKLEQSAEK